MFCTRALMTQNLCAVGMCNEKLGNHLKYTTHCFIQDYFTCCFHNFADVHVSLICTPALMNVALAGLGNF